MSNSHADDTLTPKSGHGRKKKERFADDGNMVQTSKEFQKYCKTHSTEQAEDFLQKSDEELKAVISYCTVEIREATAEVEANEEFQTAKANLKAFKDGLSEVTKPLKDSINLAAMLLNDRGQMVNPDSVAGAIANMKNALGPDTTISISKSFG